MSECKYDLCALCGKQIRKVNGRFQRYEYVIEIGGVHKLGGREVKTKRRDPGRNWACKACYVDLAPTPVYTLLHNRNTSP
jgi:hypothetical protein